MENRFVTGMQTRDNRTMTTNGADALKSTTNNLLDLYGTIGGLRDTDEASISARFGAALEADRELAFKLAFYARDIRGGLGERRVFRIILKHLALTESESLIANLPLVAEFGRWDDLWVLLETPMKKHIVDIVKSQLEEDAVADFPTLLGKWMPSLNTSSKETRKYAKTLRDSLDMSSKEYTHLLSTLRRKIDIPERKMSSGEWKDIDYAKLPSRAHMIYRKALLRHDPVGYQSYLDSLEKGETKVNASTLYPYDIVEKMMPHGYYSRHSLSHQEQVLLEQQWKALPNYLTEEEQNVVIMADVSGSMSGRPMATAVGLALYFAERNSGPYAGTFMTFSSRPAFVTIKGVTLQDRIVNAMQEDWGGSTNLEAALMLILDVAVTNRLSQDEMPKSLVIVSDMQFDSCVRSGGHTGWGGSYDGTFYDKVAETYKRSGYEIPNVVFWNVNDTKSAFQVNSGQKGVQLASGQSPSVFKTLIENVGKTPYEAMVSVLNGERYSAIKVL